METVKLQMPTQSLFYQCFQDKYAVPIWTLIKTGILNIP